MLPRRIASRYAEALFDLAQQQGKAAEWEQELAVMAQVMTTTPELAEVLTHPEIPLTQKEQIINRAFQGKISAEVLALFLLLIKRGHDPDMQLIHEVFLDKWNQARRVLPVTVTSAVPLTGEQANTLAQVLARRTGTTIKLSQVIDADLIAGLVVTMEDRVIDASASTALKDLRESMAGR